jgi:hypothetical protein
MVYGHRFVTIFSEDQWYTIGLMRLRQPWSGTLVPERVPLLDQQPLRLARRNKQGLNTSLGHNGHSWISQTAWKGSMAHGLGCARPLRGGGFDGTWMVSFRSGAVHMRRQSETVHPILQENDLGAMAEVCKTVI